MIRFSKLKLNGFKSFIDRGEIDITVGLTGIVGPNGCGKSNLVEALRWCMGESSARKMRGTGMDDVIFNGTEKRPSRNFAEVTLLLDNQTREAPAPYNQHDEIEITRRINRDKGSVYRINGKTSRARDVQMLFADTMTGANSPSLVSQGRVSEIINAKPQDRRHVLEESAGVAGLYARRHEAELRLKAAETNLTRLEDISDNMQSRLDTLKRQARQAERYKELNEEIRKLERQIAYVEWFQAKKQQQSALSIYDTAESLVAEKMKSVSEHTRSTNENKRDLPKLRDEHIKLTSTLHSQKMALARLEDDEKKIASLLQDSHEQLKRAEDDLEYETSSLKESKEQLVKTEEEEKLLHKQLENKDDLQKPLEQKQEQAKEKVSELEQKHEAELSAISKASAELNSLENECNSIEQRLHKQNTRLTNAQDTIKELKAQQEEIADAGKLTNELNAKQGSLNKNKDQLSKLDSEIEETLQRREQVDEVLKTAQQSISALEAEKRTLESFLSAVDEETVLDDMDVADGFEKAISKALGDTLLASTNPEMSKIWQNIGAKHEIPTFPEGARPIRSHIRKAPKELDLALNYIGLIDDGLDGQAISANLKAGQSIVSKDGSFWRWDGFHIKAEATDQLSVHLEHKNRLSAIDKDISEHNKQAEKQQNVHDELTEQISNIKQQNNELSQSLTQYQKDIRELEIELDKANYAKKSIDEKIKISNDNCIELAGEIEQLSASLSEKKTTLEATKSNSPETQKEKLEKLKLELNAAREEYQDATFALEKEIQEQNRRKARIHAIVDERNALKNRTIRGDEQLKKLSTLLQSLKQRIEDNKDKPDAIQAEKDKLLSGLSNIEDECTKASDKLAQAEMGASNSEKLLKAAESELSNAREERAAAQANVANTEEHINTLRTNIEGNYHCAPNMLLNKAEYALDLDDSGQDIAQTYKRLRAEKDNAIIRREKIGPVNLQAADELKEIDEQLGSILKEREDLLLAIDELRKAINTLNAEARARLIATFDEVNEHFKALFTRLYRGGKAYLQLVDSDDALDAGIEIFAQPPGKTLQSLSLMSGGEQTLASIALIFAMFLTNPSPICVLDEVDAPLDDANVDRVCDLLEEIAAHGHTRFLVITHHRLTMARMDRLYGVTMAEQGVSQLVSVDLQQELDFLDDAAA